MNGPIDTKVWGKVNSTTVILYDEPSYPDFDLERIAEYLCNEVGVREAILRRKLLSARGDSYLLELATSIASSRVLDPSKVQLNQPTKAETDYEVRHLLSEEISPGIIYDGLPIQRLMLASLPSSEKSLDHLHVAFTNRLLATFEGSDSRYHLRTILCGYPCVVSLSGLVEAPARSASYYLERRYSSTTPLAPREDTYDHLAYGDPRTTDVAVGYVAQSLMYALGADPFCKDPDCRLYNTHRQVEMLKAQLSLPEYCDRHAPILRSEREMRVGEEVV